MTFKAFAFRAGFTVQVWQVAEILKQISGNKSKAPETYSWKSTRLQMWPSVPLEEAICALQIKIQRRFPILRRSF